jgi:hypothetical protein
VSAAEGPECDPLATGVGTACLDAMVMFLFHANGVFDELARLFPTAPTPPT